jgi:predicted dehydrogenase
VSSTVKNFSQCIIGTKVVAVVDSRPESAISAAKEFGAKNWYTDHKQR